MPSKAKVIAVEDEVKQTEEAKNDGKITADESKPVSDLIDPNAPTLMPSQSRDVIVPDTTGTKLDHADQPAAVPRPSSK